MTYSDGQGNTWNEYRPPEEVLNPDSLASMRDAPVTILHPPGLVTRDVWDDVAIGHVGSDAVPEGERLVTTALVIQSGPAVARVKSGELCETSAGYTCDLDESPGIFDGVACTRVQRTIRYNHVAIGPEGFARGGPTMALRMDGVAVEVCPIPDPAPRTDSAGDPAKDITPMKTLKIKGRTFRSDAEAEMVEAQKTVDGMDEEMATLATANASISAELSATKAAAIELAQRLSALEVKVAAEEKAEPAPVTEDLVPEAIQDSIIAKRGALLTSARVILPATVKLDGLKASEIKRAVVAHVHPTVKLDGLGADTLEGLYLGATATVAAQQAKRADGVAKVAEVLTPGADQVAGVAREDGAAVNHTASLQARLVKRGSEPLTAKAT